MALTLSCACGKLGGEIGDLHPVKDSHFACMCDDCQTFAHFLGHADKILDQWGGTDILPSTPANIKITKGSDQLACVRLSPKGMFRYYSNCCKTAIGNSPGPSMPYIGMIINGTIAEGSKSTPSKDGTQSSAALAGKLGPVAGRTLGKFGIPPLPKDAVQTTTPKFLWFVAKFWFKAVIRGQGRPTPFFKADSGEPVVTPKILTPAERASFYPKHLPPKTFTT